MFHSSDLKAAWRALLTRRAYALVALLTVTLVVGAGSAVLAVISATFIRPLPFADESRLMWIYAQPPGTVRRNPLHPPTFVLMRESLTALQDVAGSWGRERALAINGAAETVAAAGVSDNFFHTLGIQPAVGRTFTKQEDRAGAKVAIVSDALWRDRFGGAPILGAPIVIDGEPHQVIGVLPPIHENEFIAADVFTPLAMYGDNLLNPNATLVTAFGRLGSGVTGAQAQSELDSVNADAVKARFNVMNGWTASFTTVREGLFGDTKPALTLLLIAVVFLGAIASANLANVTIAEMSGRRGELSLRAALGAGRVDLLRLVMIEQGILAVAGGVAGLIAARVFLPALLSLDASVAARLGDIPIDWRVQLGAFALAVAVGVLSGVIPTLMATRGDLANSLAQSGRRTSGSRRQARSRAWLVGSQTALVAVLLAASALLVGALQRSLSASPGFDPENVLGAQIRLPAATYPGIPERAIFVKRLIEEVRALPGVVAASATFNTFEGGGFNTSISIEGKPTPDGRPRTVQFRRASPGYFSLMKIPELKGRTFADADDVNAMLVAVVSESFAETFMPGEDIIGRRLVRAADPTRPVTIVGVVADVRDGGLTNDIGPTLYLPYGQNSNGAAPISLVARTAGDPRAMEASVAAALHRIDASIPLSNPTTLSAFLRDSVGPTRFRGVLLSMLAALGLVLSIVGISGVTSRGVTERTRELGVRLALGSGRFELWSAIVGRALTAVAAGLLAAVPLAFFAVRLLSQWMPGVADVSLWLVVPAWAMVLAGGVLAAALPALRAARLDPIVALRAD